MLSNTATPKYYGEFRRKVLAGEIPVNKEISMQMNQIDAIIQDPECYYDSRAVEGWIKFCENELTLTDGEDLHLLDTFKLWGEDLLGWFKFTERNIYDPKVGGYVRRKIKKRLRNKQYLIVARGAAKSMYSSCIQSYFITCDFSTTHQVTTAPTMKQAEEVLSPIKTAIVRSRGPLFAFLTEGSIQNTTGSRMIRQKLCSTKKGIENFLTNSIVEIRPMSIDKLQGLRCKVSTIDEWLSGDIKESPVGALEQGAAKGGLDDYLIIATSSEGTVRNGSGDTIKMELLDILKADYYEDNFKRERTHKDTIRKNSIWWYKLDDITEVSKPELWVKAQPNLGKTVSYETYQDDVDRAELAPASRNDILAKRFGIPCEGYTYFFTYEETIPHAKRDFWQMPCSMGADLSQGGDFCSFSFVFPLTSGRFGIKTINYITEFTLSKLPAAMRSKYQEFIDEGSLYILPGTILDMNDVYDDLNRLIDERVYDVRSFGFDPYNAKEFVNRWVLENGEFGVEKVIQGAKTESVPLTELKKLAEERLLIFDEKLMMFAMGNCIVIEDTNGNKKLMKKNYEAKIDAVASTIDAFVAYKLNKDSFE